MPDRAFWDFSQKKCCTQGIFVFPVVYYFTNTPHTYTVTSSYNCALKTGPGFTQHVNKNTGSVHMTWYWGAFVQPVLQWKSSICCIHWICVCSLRYLVCNAHAPYFHLWTVWLYNIFPHYLINGKILDNKNWTKICVLIFSTTFVWNFSHSRKNWARNDQKRISLFM